MTFNHFGPKSGTKFHLNALYHAQFARTFACIIADFFNQPHHFAFNCMNKIIKQFCYFIFTIKPCSYFAKLSLIFSNIQVKFSINLHLDINVTENISLYFIPKDPKQDLEWLYHLNCLRIQLLGSGLP